MAGAAVSYSFEGEPLSVPQSAVAGFRERTPRPSRSRLTWPVLAPPSTMMQ